MSEYIPLFVYGSLRQRGQLFPMIQPAIAHGPVLGKIQGFELYEAGYNGSYPYLVHAEEGEVVGELLLTTDCLELRQTLSMEIGAGYELEKVDVIIDDDDPVPAYACIWNRTSGLGRKVQSGDWIKYLYSRKEFVW